MRITRAAKVAAFPLTALILVALIACQGPAGPAGAAGEPGDTGAAGEPGMAGAPGADAPIPLTGRDGDVVIDSLNAGKDENEATEFTIDLHAAGYFNGGMAPFTYKVTRVLDSNGTDVITPAADQPVVTAAIDDDTNMLELKLHADRTTHFSDAADYMMGFTIELSAEDANKESATSKLVLKPNQAPQNATGVTSDADGLITSTEAAIVIGTMDGETDTDTKAPDLQPRTDGVAMCKTFNTCELVLFVDQDDIMLSFVHDPSGHLSAQDMGDGKALLTGMTATATDPATPVELDVTATDTDGLETTLRLNVTVDPAPTISEAGMSVVKTIEIDSVGGTAKVFNSEAAAQGAFNDASVPAQTPAAITFESKNTSIVTVEDAAGGTLTGVGRGTTTVVMTGTTGEINNTDTDGLGQFATITFTVTVK